jgi:hypothetical protein
VAVELQDPFDACQTSGAGNPATIVVLAPPKRGEE